MTTVAVHVHPDASSARGGETLFETVAEEAFRHYARVWKPGTLAVNRVYLRSRFAVVRSLRHRGPKTTCRGRFAFPHTSRPADRSLPILSVIFAMFSRAARRCRACRCPSSRACSATPGPG